MKAGYKVLIGLAVALGLAFFLFKKTVVAEDAVSGSTGMLPGGGVSEATAGVIKTIVKGIKKFFAPAAAATGGAGVLAGGGAGLSAAAAGGNIVVGGGSLVAAPVAASLGPSVAAAPVVPGSAAGGGAAGMLGGAIATAAFIGSFIFAMFRLGKVYEKRTVQEIAAEWEKTRLAQTASGWNVGNEGPVGPDTSAEVR